MTDSQRIIRRMLTTDLLEFHAFCLTNTGTRLQQYAAALDQVIEPGDTVLDLGAGLGVLGILACRAGARRVMRWSPAPHGPWARTWCAPRGWPIA